MSAKSLRLGMFALSVGVFLGAGMMASKLPDKWKALDGESGARGAFKTQVIVTVLALVSGMALFRAAWHMRVDTDSNS